MKINRIGLRIGKKMTRDRPMPIPKIKWDRLPIHRPCRWIGRSLIIITTSFSLLPSSFLLMPRVNDWPLASTDLFIKNEVPRHLTAGCSLVARGDLPTA